MLNFYSFALPLVVAMLIIISRPLTMIQQKAAAGGMLAVGLSSMFANFGRGLFYEESVSGLNEKDGGSPKFYGRYNIFLVLPDMATIYSMLYALLGLVFTGVLEETSEPITMTAADSFFTGGMILGISAVGGVMMGLVFRKTKPLYEDPKYFGKKMQMVIAPHFINIVGLTVGIVIIVFSGMMG